MLWLLVTWAGISKARDSPALIGHRALQLLASVFQFGISRPLGSFKIDLPGHGHGTQLPAARPQLCGSTDASAEPGWGRTAADPSWRGLRPAPGRPEWGDWGGLLPPLQPGRPFSPRGPVRAGACPALSPGGGLSQTLTWRVRADRTAASGRRGAGVPLPAAGHGPAEHYFPAGARGSQQVLRTVKERIAQVMLT